MDEAVFIDLCSAHMARIAVPFTFDASNAFACSFSGTSFTREDCIVQVEQLLLTPLVTRAHIRLIPGENTQEAAQALADKYDAFSLTDESGAPVAYSGMDAMYGDRPNVVCVGGQWLCRYREEMPGLLRFPESIGVGTAAGEILRFDLPLPE